MGDGGTALWLSDMTQSLGLNTQIYGLDENLENIKVKDSPINFKFCDNGDVQKWLPTKFWNSIPRPCIILEDSHKHTENLLP